MTDSLLPLAGHVLIATYPTYNVCVNSDPVTPRLPPDPDRPEEQQHGLREGLEVVVPVDVGAVHHGYLPKHLKQTV